MIALAPASAVLLKRCLASHHDVGIAVRRCCRPDRRRVCGWGGCEGLDERVPGCCADCGFVSGAFGSVCRFARWSRIARRSARLEEQLGSLTERDRLFAFQDFPAAYLYSNAKPVGQWVWVDEFGATTPALSDAILDVVLDGATGATVVARSRRSFSGAPVNYSSANLLNNAISERYKVVSGNEEVDILRPR